MSTLALNKLLEYILSLSLSDKNKDWLAGKILESKKAQPNATTIKAIEDVRAGKTFKASSVDDLLNQCLS